MDFRYWVHHGWDVVDGSSPPSPPYRRSRPGEHPPYVRECPLSGFLSNWIVVCTSMDLCLSLCLTGNVVSSRGSSPPLPPSRRARSTGPMAVASPWASSYLIHPSPTSHHTFPFPVYITKTTCAYLAHISPQTV